MEHCSADSARVHIYGQGKDSNFSLDRMRSERLKMKIEMRI